MRGMIIGWLLGGAFAIGLIFFLNIWDVWAIIGSTASMIWGFALGTLFANLGMFIGGSLDDSY